MADLKYRDGSNWVSLVDLLYPVGSIVMRYTNTSPASSIGGTWVEIKEKFPYFNSSNSTGGSNTYTLQVSDLPDHQHETPGYLSVNEASGYGLLGNGAFGDRALVNAPGGKGLPTRLSGGGQTSFSLMPSYQSVWAFRRTA